jgi:hypothetical protein
MLTDFLQALYGNAPGGYLEVRLMHEHSNAIEKKWRAMPLAEIKQAGIDKLLAANEQGWHVYFRVALSSQKRSRKADISHITALWFDVDAEDSTDFLDKSGFEPHVLVRSGSGYHGYFLLDAPLAVQDNLPAIERTLAGIAACYGGDGKVKDVTRILRLPGFYNVKEKYGDSKPLCEVVYIDTEPTSTGMCFPPYRFDELYTEFAHYAQPAQPHIKRELPSVQYDGQIDAYVKTYLETSIGQGERNSWLFNTAMHCKGLGMSQTEAETTLLTKAMSDGLTQTEAGKTIASAYNRSVAPISNRYRRLQSVMAMEDSA